MTRVGLLLLFLLWPVWALAQDDDRSRLVTLLEEALSDDAARQVRIEGFRGALSSVAALDRLTIADAGGVWLTLEEVTLDWNRAALLSRALEVNRLSAARLTLARWPEASGGLPAAEAQPFTLPELPLSIDIAEMAITRVELGAPILGEELALSIAGRARLAEGAGQGDLSLTRLDGPEGRFGLSAGFDNETRDLRLDLAFEEAAGGIAAGRLGLPGTPAVALSVAGEGPLSDFTADLDLSTDGAPRLAGQVTVRETEEGSQQIDLDIAGDVTAILLPEYRAFFGPDVALRATLAQEGNGALTLDPFQIEAAALALRGDLRLNAARQPEGFHLTGTITPPSGDSVLLPVGDNLRVGAVDLEVGYDRVGGQAWQADLLISDLTNADLSVAQSQLAITGKFVEAAEGLAAADARLRGTLSGLSPTDPGLAEALGPQAELAAEIAWRADAPLTIRDLDLSFGETARLTGGLSADLAKSALVLTYDLTAQLSALSRFAALAGQPLAGQADLTVAGHAALPSGAFDLTLTGQTTDLRVSDDLPPALLDGVTALGLDLRRDTDGVLIENLRLTGQELTATGSGRASSGASALTLEAELRNGGLFTNALSGPVGLQARVTRDGSAPWAVNADLTGTGGTALTLRGAVGAEDGQVDLALTGNAPLALADPFIAPRSVRGRLTFDLALDGAPDPTNLSGRITTTDARVAAPNIGLSVSGLSAATTLSGGQARVEASGTLSSGGQLRAGGAIGITDPGLPANLTVSLTNGRLVDPALYDLAIPSAQVTLQGSLTGSNQVAGRVDIGPSEIRVPETGLAGGEGIPDITHRGETAAQRQTRRYAGLLQTGAAGGAGGDVQTALDITVAAPGRIFLRGRGLDAELGGALRLGGSAAAVIPDGQFSLIRGRLQLLGQRLDLTEGSATLSGDFDPILRLVAETRSGRYLIRILVEGIASNPEVRFTSEPELPEDEVLAQLLFGRSISGLSALQAVQLADAVAGLAGVRSGPGLFERLRTNLGLDDLDIQTGEDGGAAVRAGRYLSENVYTDVTVGSGGGADVSLNIDLTPNITARGSVDGDGQSRLGIFFERDY